MKQETVTLRTRTGAPLKAYRALPAGPVKGGLILAMEIFGVTDHIKDLARGFAVDGYDVLAPALYDRIEPDFAVGYGQDDIARAMTLRDQVMFHTTGEDLQAAIDALAAHGHTRIHAVGYCYGGSVAWLAACRCTGLTSAVGYYGRHIIDFVDERPRVPVMLHFGNRDKSIPLENVDTIAHRHPDVIVHVYNADHGFNSDRRANYDAEATRTARARTLAFFEKA